MSERPNFLVSIEGVEENDETIFFEEPFKTEEEAQACFDALKEELEDPHGGWGRDRRLWLAESDKWGYHSLDMFEV